MNPSPPDPHSQISKFLSYVLRHRPEEIGLTLDPEGWVGVVDLITAAQAHGQQLDADVLHDVVATNSKKRFEFSPDATRIRASQGHSVTVELGYTAQVPPDVLHHGTVDRFLDSIRLQGLVKGDRHHVHLSADVQTAQVVGSRRGKPVLLVIQAREMHVGGYAFYLSTNGVWLTESVPTAFLSFPSEERFHKPMSKRSQRASTAADTLACIEAGQYPSPSGGSVQIRALVDAAVHGSRAVPPDEVLANPNRKQHSTNIEVQQATTLQALHELYHAGAPGLGCLNFASAKNAGGGFLNGSLAQEESLACNSALYPCQIACHEYYNANRASANALYTDWMIWSPLVPFIRYDDGTHPEQPYLAHVITAPAPNAGAVAHKIPDAPSQVLTALKRRASRVCQLAAQQGVQTFVLGAWGCGVFCNDPTQVAKVFADLLQPGSEFEGVFKRIVFAIHDPINGTPVYRAFKNTLFPNP